VKHFYYDNGTQPVGYEDSDHPGVGWRYLYDGACRRVGKEQINTTTGEVTSRVMFLHEGDVLFGEYHTVNTMDPHMVGSAVLWPTDPGTGEILGQITINTNTSITDSVTGHGGGNGYYPGGYSGDTGGNNNADDPYSQHNNPNNGGYNDSPYHRDDSATGDGAGGVLGWPQERVDAVFYSMVCDLAGAPKELIDPTTGEVVGYATYTLFGKRHWAGTVNTPLLFTGQYEDTESGWVYNRFRYYDPHAGVYNAQDPLGLLANLGTAQGYVTNPVTWVDVLGLKGCGRKPELDPKQATVAEKSLDLNRKLRKIYKAERMEHRRLRKKFTQNVAGVRTAEGPFYFGMGSTRDLNLSLHDSNMGILIQHGFTGGPNEDWFGHHAEQVLLRRIECDGLTPVEVQSIKEVCDGNYLSCRTVLENKGFVRLSDYIYMLKEEHVKMLSELDKLERM